MSRGRLIIRALVTAAILIAAGLLMCRAEAQGPVGSWHGTARHGGQGINGSTISQSAWQMLQGQGETYFNPETGTWVHVNGQYMHVYGTQGNPITGMAPRPGQVASKVERGSLQAAGVPTSVRVRAAAGAWATAAWEAAPKGEVFVAVVPGWLPYCPLGASECLERIKASREG